MRKPLIGLTVAMALIPSIVEGAWVEAEGSYLFPPTMTEAEACRYAEDRAQVDAIRKQLGQHVSAEDTLRCTEQSGFAECSRNSSIWSTVDGFVAETRNRLIHTYASIAGHRKCVVTFRANVKIANGRPDPNFDISVSMNQPVFRSGENMTLRLVPSQKMWVQVFQWIPYSEHHASIFRLFPNAFDHATAMSEKSSVPSTGAEDQYMLRVTFPVDAPPASNMVDEYLIVVATKTPLNMRDEYEFDHFRRLLAEIPRDQIRIVRRAYNVVRSKP